MSQLAFSNIKEVNEFANKIQVSTNTVLQCKQFIEAANKLFKKAKSLYNSKDEENAYILYMRYLYIITEIKKSYEYRKAKEKLNVLLKEVNPIEAVEKAEELHKSLEEKYKKKTEQKELEKTLSANKKKKTITNGTVVNSKEVNDLDELNLPDVPTGFTSNTESKPPSINTNITKDKENEQNGEKKQPDQESEISRSLPASASISVTELYELFKTRKMNLNQILVIDIRPSNEYQSSRVQHSNSINISPSLLTHGANLNSVERNLSKDVWEIWKDRFSKQYIVIIDYDFNHLSSTNNLLSHPVVILEDILCKTEAEYTVYVLSGGFSNWILHYPAMTTDPSYKKIQFVKNTTDADLLLEELSYPTLPSEAKRKLQEEREAEERRLREEHESQAKKKKEENDRLSQMRRMSSETDKQSPNVEKTNKETNSQTTTNGVLYPSLVDKPNPLINNFLSEDETLNDKINSTQDQQNVQNHTFKQPEGNSKDIKYSGGVPIGGNSKSLDEDKNIFLPIPKPTSQTQKPTQHAQPQIPGPQQQTQLKPYSKIIPQSIPPNNPLPEQSVKPAQQTLPVSNTEQIPTVPQNVNKQNSDITKPPNSKMDKNTANNGNKNIKSVGYNNQISKETLPAGWEKKIDKPSGKPFYLDHNTKTTHWTLPTFPAANDLPPNRPTGQNLPNVAPSNIPISPKQPIVQKQPVVPKQTGSENRQPTTTVLPLQPQKPLAPSGTVNNNNNINIAPKTIPQIVQPIPPTVNHSKNLEVRPKVQNVSKNLDVAKQPSLKRSLSSPNLAENLENPQANKGKPTPNVDRSAKPSFNPSPQRQVSIDRSTKPISRNRLLNLSPVYGGKGLLLTGLKNLGNTCYMNSVLQCLVNTAPLVSYFSSGLYEKDLNSSSNNINPKPGYLAREFSFLMTVLKSGTYRSVSPTEFKLALGSMSKRFLGYEQQDSHEVLLILLDGLHNDINKVKIKSVIPKRENSSLQDEEAAEQEWKDNVTNNESLIFNLFQGQFRSIVMCLTCKYRSKTFNTFNCLHLQMPQGRTVSLEQCLQSFIKPEKIDNWHCDRCKCDREAAKNIELWKLPPVIIIQFKRFRFEGIWINKIQTNVDYPVQNLDLSKYIVGPSKQYSKFQLYGSIKHSGSFESGHYTAHCENAYTRNWYLYNDERVDELDRSSIKTNQAYVLFYTAVNFQDYLRTKSS